MLFRELLETAEFLAGLPLHLIGLIPLFSSSAAGAAMAKFWGDDLSKEARTAVV